MHVEKQTHSVPPGNRTFSKRQYVGSRVQRISWVAAVIGLMAASIWMPDQAVSIFSAAGIYFVLMIVFRLAGKRTAAQLTTFDLILLLIISETTQNTMVRDNNSFINAALLIITLVVVDIGMSMLKMRFEKLERLLEGEPMTVVENGRPLTDRMQIARIDEEDVLSVARLSRGIDRMEDIQRAVLEASGGISIIPRPAGHPSYNHSSNANPAQELDST